MIRIEPFEPYGQAFEELRAEAALENYRFIETLRRRWDDDSDRYAKAGEVFLSAQDNGVLMAVGGLNRDPYLNDGTGRVRHVYVRPPYRGKGIGKILVVELIERAKGSFPSLRLRAADADAAAFYDALGFDRVTEPTATHRMTFSAA